LGRGEVFSGDRPRFKMAKVHVCNVVVLDNPSPFLNPFQFEITFECIEDLPEDLEWKILYVGSAESEEYDQTLDTVYVGPVPEGRHMFVFQADPPVPERIPEADLIGVTVVLLTCSYRGAEFIRVGYYVSNEYTVEELRETPPSPPQFDNLQRNILATNPRVTKFKINWADGTPIENAENQPPKNDPNQMISENSQSMDGPLKSANPQPSGSQSLEQGLASCSMDTE